MPPDFSLRPPRPGAPRPMEQSERTQAEEALVPQTALGTPQAGDSPGQEALVQAAGPAPPQPDPPAGRRGRPAAAGQNELRQQAAVLADAAAAGIVVDPQKEAQRLRENAALGESPDTGDTPIIQPRKKGWLEGLF